MVNIPNQTLPPVNTKALKGKFYFLLFTMFALSIALLFWNQYRPRIILDKCSEVSSQASQSYLRNSLPDDKDIKPYDQLVNECLSDFGY